MSTRIEGQVSLSSDDGSDSLEDGVLSDLQHAGALNYWLVTPEIGERHTAFQGFSVDLLMIPGFDDLIHLMSVLPASAYEVFASSEQLLRARQPMSPKRVSIINVALFLEHWPQLSNAPGIHVILGQPPQVRAAISAIRDANALFVCIDRVEGAINLHDHVGLPAQLLDNALGQALLARLPAPLRERTARAARRAPFPQSDEPSRINGVTIANETLAESLGYVYRGISIERSRAVSAAFKAAESSSLTLLEAFEAIEAFAFHGYNNSPKPGETSSRYAIRQKAERSYPHGGRKVSWDMKFLIATSIESPDDHYKLWTGRGIHVYGKWYSSPRLLVYRGYKKDISVRLEPYADSVIYVCIEGKWLECRNSEAPLQLAMSETSLLFRSAERHDLSALRAELTNDMNRCVAEIVNEKLREIAGRKESGNSHPTASDVNSDDSPELSTFVPFNFDDIEPYENETP